MFNYFATKLQKKLHIYKHKGQKITIFAKFRTVYIIIFAKTHVFEQINTKY